MAMRRLIRFRNVCNVQLLAKPYARCIAHSCRVGAEAHGGMELMTRFFEWLTQSH